MRDSKKSQLAGIAGAIGIAILAFFLIFSLNSLQWPLAASLGKAISDLPSPTPIPDGILAVNVLSNLTVFPGVSSINSQFGITNSGSFNQTENLSGVTVAVYSGPSLRPILTNYTNSQGQAQEDLAPNTYSVRLIDWRLNNLTTTVQISSNKITNLNVTLNATSYAIQLANIADPDFSGWAVSWGQIFALIDANQSVTAHSPQIYLDTEYAAFTPMSRVGFLGVTPISVGASNQNNGSQWIQFQVKVPLDISRIVAMSILALRSEYRVNTIDIQ
jgi:hypothetical protein